MILLDTHIWLWWVVDRARLSEDQRDLLDGDGFQSPVVSAVSCWEVALAASRGRMTLSKPPERWVTDASRGLGIEVMPLSAEIAISSVTLPGEFHRDPADRFIVATARTLGCPLLTADAKILAYEHVETVG